MFQEGKKWFITKVQKLGKKGRGIVLCERFAVKGTKFRVQKLDITSTRKKKFPEIISGPGVIVTLSSIAASKRGFMYLRKETGFVGGDIVLATVISSPH